MPMTPDLMVAYGLAFAGCAGALGTVLWCAVCGVRFD